MKLSNKTVLSIFIFVVALVTTTLVFSAGKSANGMDGMSEHHNSQMMGMDNMHKQMQNMSDMMDEAHNTQDMHKRHELMQKHMEQMQEMMENINGRMGENMPGNMTMEQRQKVMSERLDIMQNLMRQMLKQQSMMMDFEK